MASRAAKLPEMKAAVVVVALLTFPSKALVATSSLGSKKFLDGGNSALAIGF